MKRNIVMIIAFTTSLAAWAASEPQQPPPRTISVSGSSVGYIPKDTILWDITFRSAGRDLLDAKAASDQRLKDLLEVCAAQGIQGSNVVASIPKIQDARQNSTDVAGEPGKPFVVTRIVTLRQQDLRRFTELLDALSHAKNFKVHYQAVSSKEAAMGVILVS